MADDMLADQEPLDLEALRTALPINGLGTSIIYAPVIPSTNSLALDSIARDAVPGLLILTDAQPQGRGRQGRAWHSMPGQQILLSLLLTPPFAPRWLVMMSALGLFEALVESGLPDERVGIKWPNDVLIDGRKVAGILIETTTGRDGALWAVVGLGVNVNGSLEAESALAGSATTVATALGHPIAREALLLAFLRHLGAHYAALARTPTATAPVLAQWRERLVTLGRTVVVHQGDQQLRGMAENLTEDGALLLRDDGGIVHTILWGDIES